MTTLNIETSRNLIDRTKDQDIGNIHVEGVSNVLKQVLEGTGSGVYSSLDGEAQESNKGQSTCTH